MSLGKTDRVLVGAELHVDLAVAICTIIHKLRDVDLAYHCGNTLFNVTTRTCRSAYGVRKTSKNAFHTYWAAAKVPTGILLICPTAAGHSNSGHRTDQRVPRADHGRSGLHIFCLFDEIHCILFCECFLIISALSLFWGQGRHRRWCRAGTRCKESSQFHSWFASSTALLSQGHCDCTSGSSSTASFLTRETLSLWVRVGIHRGSFFLRSGSALLWVSAWLNCCWTRRSCPWLIVSAFASAWRKLASWWSWCGRCQGRS